MNEADGGLLRRSALKKCSNCALSDQNSNDQNRALNSNASKMTFFQNSISGSGSTHCSSCSRRRSRSHKLKSFPSKSIALITVLVLCIVQVSISEEIASSSSSSESSPNTNTFFIRGLADSFRRINSQQLSNLSQQEPFVLQFRTACPFGKIVNNDDSEIGLNSQGNLTYSTKDNFSSSIINTEKSNQSKQTSTTQYHNVIDHSWHSILFSGSAIYLQNPQPSNDSPSEIFIQNISDGNSTHTYNFFDGFVGCIRVIPISIKNHEEIIDYEYATEERTRVFEEFFYLDSYTLPSCSENNFDLSDEQTCHNPRTFVFCSSCQHGSKCIQNTLEDNNRCNCTGNFTGSYCDELNNTEDNNKIDQGSGTNKIENIILPPTPPTATSPTATSAVGPEPDNSSICSNGGVLKMWPNETQTCECTKGWEGSTCSDDINECTQQVALCKNGAICINIKGYYECFCRPGFSGVNCEIDFNECLSNPCVNGGVCNDRINGYECVCSPGYTGKMCEIDIDECENDPCANSGTCIDQVAGFVCRCSEGFEGVVCQVNIDECSTNPCLNDGECHDGIAEFICNCNGTGYEGHTCNQNINDCEGVYCEHAGVCRDEVLGYNCECKSGYLGDHCEIDYEDCQSSPCQNMGTCYAKSDQNLYKNNQIMFRNHTVQNTFLDEFSYDDADGFLCDCEVGFEGSTCSINIDDCNPKACHNGGTCKDGINSYSCMCLPGYTGIYCEQNIDDCVMNQNPCLKGICYDKINDYHCECEENYGGKNCSIFLTACQNNPCGNYGNCTAFYDGNQNSVQGPDKHYARCKCENGYSGEICEKETTLSFSGDDGYVEVLTSVGQLSNKYELKFRFRTTLGNALIAAGKGATYFVLSLIGGKLNLQSSLLNSLNGISSGSNLSNAEWHKVWIHMNDTHIAVAVNAEQTIHPISPQEAEEDSSNLMSQFLSFNKTALGKIPSEFFLGKNKEDSDFVGCIQDIYVNRHLVIPIDNASNVVISNVQTGCQRKEQCVPNPCQNSGMCTDLWKNFKCTCKRPYLGPRCQFEYKAATFGHELLNNSFAQVKIKPEITRKFGNAFNISMFVRTREPRGTIFFLGDEGRGKNLYMKAQVEEDGQISVIARLDDNKEEIYNVGGLQINDGKVHFLSIHREKGLVTISIDGNEHFRKSLKEKGSGPIQFYPTILYVGGVPSNNTSSNLTIDSTNEDNEDASTALPSTEMLNRLTFPSLNKMKPFKGVIQDLRVNLSSSEFSTNTTPMRYVVEFFPLDVNTSMGDPLGKNVTLYQVLEGVVSDNSCKESPCFHEGVCNVTWNDFECQCSDEYAGKTCNIRLPCANVICPKKSVCQNIGYDGFECVSNATFDGKGSFSPHYLLKTNEMVNLTFNEIFIKYRSKKGGTLMHLTANNQSFRIDLTPPRNITVFITIDTTIKEKIEIEDALNGSWQTISLQLNVDNSLFLKHGDKLPIHIIDTLPADFFKNLVTAYESQIILGSNFRDTSRYPSSNYNTNTINTNTRYQHPETLHQDYFRGCLDEVRIGSHRLTYVTQSEIRDVNRDNANLDEESFGTEFYIDESHIRDNDSSSEYLGCVLCYESECLNNGFCKNKEENYSCSCPLGFEGGLCEKNIDECLNNPLCVNGKCVDQIANYTCDCKRGYQGWLCDEEINECDTNPCLNNAACVDKIGFYTCTCTEDFIGVNCEKRKFSTCQDQPCQNGAECIRIAKNSEGISFKCSCPLDYTGITCSEMIDYCATEDCFNGGNCSNVRGGFRCTCPMGFDGPHCEKNIDDCEKNPCVHGRCLDGIASYTCNCTGSGFEGIHCENDVNECYERIGICGKNHVCENMIGSYICNCQEGTCGEQCDMEDPCWGNSSLFCQYENSYCNPICPPDRNISHECLCKEGFRDPPYCLLEAHQHSDTINIALIIIPVLAAFLIGISIAIIILVKMARKKRATRGVYSPSQQEYCNPRVELDNVMKPPPEERLI